MLDDSDKDIKKLGKIAKLKMSFKNLNPSIESSVRVKLVNGDYYSGMCCYNYKSLNFFFKYQCCKECKFKFDTYIEFF